VGACARARKGTHMCTRMCSHICNPRAHTQGWNLRHLDTLLSTVLKENGSDELPGVNAPYLYFGTWRSVFAWCVWPHASGVGPAGVSS